MRARAEDVGKSPPSFGKKGIRPKTPTSPTHRENKRRESGIQVVPCEEHPESRKTQPFPAFRVLSFFWQICGAKGNAKCFPSAHQNSRSRFSVLWGLPHNRAHAFGREKKGRGKELAPMHPLPKEIPLLCFWSKFGLANLRRIGINA